MKIFSESNHLNDKTKFNITFRSTLDRTIEQDENDCYKHDKYDIILIWDTLLYILYIQITYFKY